MTNQGHIKIDRRILNWEWYRDSNMVHVFLHLLLNANYADGRFQGVLVKRGQLIIGRLKLAMALGLTERQIRTCLNKLKMTNEISIQTTNKFSIVTICKYDSYQSSQVKSDQQNDPQSGKQKTNKRPTKDQQATTIEEGKESKESKENKEYIEGVIYAFDSNEFIRAYNNWYKYRKQKKKTLTERGMELQSEMLKKYPESIAIEIINKSIMNGWIGLFEPKGTTQSLNLPANKVQESGMYEVPTDFDYQNLNK